MNYNPKVNAHPTPAGLRRVLDRVAVKLPGALLGGYRGGSFEETLFGQPVRRSWYTRVFNNPNSAVSFLYFDGRVNEFSGFEAYLQRQKDQSDDNDYEFVSNFSYKNKVASWKSVSVYGPKPNQVSTDWVAAKAYKGGIIEVMAPTLSHARKVLAAIR